MNQFLALSALLANSFFLIFKLEVDFMFTDILVQAFESVSSIIGTLG
nr:hypothetical protein [Alkalicoccobacillus plakortidis]